MASGHCWIDFSYSSRLFATDQKFSRNYEEKLSLRFFRFTITILKLQRSSRFSISYLLGIKSAFFCGEFVLKCCGADYIGLGLVALV